MNITLHINDNPIDVPQNSTLLDAVTAFGALPPFALLLNQNFIPASEHASTAVQENDRIEIISAIQGG
ncbi:sulfur carrier protein ThiS [Thiomicrorhabdus sp. zzn3]|uniref:sulfur carrier protein ThiS n=1 Tax=Thiomicrorhabdus sp. zzn3 TaxID=3039775 RepID=UPI0024372AEA|nr:sulfur carrier protein ThiS [Thiomicrorhabdus sp. zzn3]MDG6779079.1 sulfur carrier protein ThiS [Thiomicrorhabdus sp. zzn3]